MIYETFHKDYKRGTQILSLNVYFSVYGSNNYVKHEGKKKEREEKKRERERDFTSKVVFMLMIPYRWLVNLLEVDNIYFW